MSTVEPGCQPWELDINEKGEACILMVV
jgi:hypothetical protein